MTENSDFMARYMPQDNDDPPRRFTARSPHDRPTGEMRMGEHSIGDPDAPAAPRMSEPDQFPGPESAEAESTAGSMYERPAQPPGAEFGAGAVAPAPSPPAGDEGSTYSPALGGPPWAGDYPPPPQSSGPQGGRVGLTGPPPVQQGPPPPVQQGSLRHSGPPNGGWLGAQPYGGPNFAEGQQRGFSIPQRPQFDQRALAPAPPPWARPQVDPSERWAPRADTQVGQHVPARSVKVDEVSKRRREPAEIGWRKAVYASSGGLINLGAGKHEQKVRDWAALIKSNIPGNYQIAAVSVKGGVGKTRVTAGVGTMFALERGQPVLAIDADPTYGGLGRFVDPTAWTSIRDLLGSKERVVDYPTARRFTGRNKQGLEVLAGNQNVANPMELDDSTFFDTVALARRFYQLCLVDSGTDVESDFFKAVLSVSDALMIVGSCGVDGGLAVEQTINWLAARNGHELLKRSVIVLNDANRSMDKKFVSHIRQTVGPRVRAVHTIPWDQHLRDGADLDYGALGKRTRLALMELAADLAQGFPTAGALAQ